MPTVANDHVMFVTTTHTHTHMWPFKPMGLECCDVILSSALDLTLTFSCLADIKLYRTCLVKQEDCRAYCCDDLSFHHEIQDEHWDRRPMV